MKARTPEQAQEIINNILDALRVLAEADEGVAVPLTNNDISRMLTAMQLVGKFMYSHIFETVQYQEDDLRLELVSRLDILGAFKRHTLSLLTNVCQECGESMDNHNHKDGPPHRSMH